MPCSRTLPRETYKPEKTPKSGWAFKRKIWRIQKARLSHPQTTTLKPALPSQRAQRRAASPLAGHISCRAFRMGAQAGIRRLTVRDP